MFKVYLSNFCMTLRLNWLLLSKHCYSSQVKGQREINSAHPPSLPFSLPQPAVLKLETSLKYCFVLFF